MRSIEGMSVSVTGGGSGLDAATAARMVSRGAHVAICGRRPEKVQSDAESIGFVPRMVGGRSYFTTSAELFTISLSLTGGKPNIRRYSRVNCDRLR